MPMQPRYRGVLERVRTLAFRLLLLISRKGNLLYCDFASCGGHIRMLFQKQDLESSAAEPYKISSGVFFQMIRGAEPQKNQSTQYIYIDLF